ncbi:MAG: PAS domain S-box protein, partial [Oscillospiraceae bacterium]|nr:PAS domain S-box protein [Oscillospiraceae bacterium]
MPVSSGVYESDGEYIITGFVPVFSPGGEVVGVVGADISAGKVRSDAFSFAARVALISVLLIAALSAVAYILSEKLFGRRLRLVADAAVKLAAGDTSLPQTGAGKDETGIIAGNLSVICGSINSLTAGILGFEAQLPDDDYDKLEGIFSPLKQSISKSKSIIENVDLLIYVSDAKTYDILFANRKMLETVGLTSEEIKDKKCWQVFYKGMAGPCPFCPNPKLLADNNEINLYKSERYDRFAKKWYLTQSTIIKWPDGKTAHFKTATDITKQKEYEIGMKNLSAIIAVEDAGIIVKDKLGIVNEWNIGAQNILGYLREEVIGKTSKDFAPYEGHAIIDRTYEQLLNGEHITNIEEIRLHKDGREINCSISYTPILDDDGIVTGSVSIFHDITEKKKIEKEHKQLESTLLNLFDNLSNGFALFELFTDGGGEENLRLFMANKAFRNFSDKKKEKDLTGLAFAEVFGAAPEEISYYITVAKTGGGRTNESYNYVLKKHISEVVFSPSRGQVALLLTDRTHLVKAQEALLKREKDLAMLFGSMTAGFCMGQVIYDADNKPEDVVFEIVNSAYETLEDFAPGTLLGKKLLEISPDEHKEHFKVYTDVAINRRKATFSKYIASKGKTLDVVCYSPSEGYFACIENDVTEREKKDQELKKAYRDTQAILGEIPAPICIISRENGVILGCNKAFVRLCVAVNENELKNSKIGNLLITEEKDTDMKKLFGSGKFKGFLKKHDGSLVEVEVFAKPFVYEEQVAYAVCCIDISQQRLQEEILREAALNAAETSRLKSMFLANMSHEIRTPMNGIIGLTELALDSDNLTEKTADYLNKIKISATGLLGIINDILDISKIEAGKTELETLPFIFGDIFKSCETIVADMKEKENEVKLLLNYSEISFEKVKGDPTKLRQIFMNLLSNAVKFT